MAFIYETDNFILESHEKPEISREEWWHMKISPKRDIVDRTELTKEEAIDLVLFTINIWKAYKIAMKNRWIEIWRINYQDNWNWKPHFHIHIYWRAINAINQKYWEPLIPWNKDEYIKLNNDDILEIKKQIEIILGL